MAATTIYLHRETNAPSVPLVFTGAALSGTAIEIVLAPKFAGPEVRLTTGAGDIVIVDDERLILIYDAALVAALPLGLVTTWDAYQIDGEERRHLGGGMVRVLGAGESAPGGDVTVQVPGIQGPAPWVHRGVWVAGTYPAKSSTTHLGSTWLTLVETSEEPGVGADWEVLAQKGGQGNTGQTPDISIGTVTTLAAGAPATFIRRPESADEAPVIDVGLPQGAPGVPGDITIVDLAASRAVAVGDKASLLRNPDATARSLTFNLDLPVGFWTTGIQRGSGVVTLVAGAGVTFFPAGGGTVTLGAGAAWAATVLSNTGSAAEVWLRGDLQ